jgi:hypothetical protein
VAHTGKSRHFYAFSPRENFGKRPYNLSCSSSYDDYSQSLESPIGRFGGQCSPVIMYSIKVRQ